MNSRAFKIGTLRCGMKKRAPATILNFCPDFSSSGKSLDRFGKCPCFLQKLSTHWVFLQNPSMSLAKAKQFAFLKNFMNISKEWVSVCITWV